MLKKISVLYIDAVDSLVYSLRKNVTGVILRVIQPSHSGCKLYKEFWLFSVIWIIELFKSLSANQPVNLPNGIN